MKFDADLINAIAEVVAKIIEPEVASEVRHTYVRTGKGIEGGYYEFFCPHCSQMIMITDGTIEAARNKSEVKNG